MFCATIEKLFYINSRLFGQKQPWRISRGRKNKYPKGDTDLPKNAFTFGKQKLTYVKYWF